MHIVSTTTTTRKGTYRVTRPLIAVIRAGRVLEADYHAIKQAESEAALVEVLVAFEEFEQFSERREEVLVGSRDFAQK